MSKSKAERYYDELAKEASKIRDFIKREEPKSKRELKSSSEEDTDEKNDPMDVDDGDVYDSEQSSTRSGADEEKLYTNFLGILKLSYENYDEAKKIFKDTLEASGNTHHLIDVFVKREAEECKAAFIAEMKKGKSSQQVLEDLKKERKFSSASVSEIEKHVNDLKSVGGEIGEEIGEEMLKSLDPEQKFLFKAIFDECKEEREKVEEKKAEEKEREAKKKAGEAAEMRAKKVEKGETREVPKGK